MIPSFQFRQLSPFKAVKSVSFVAVLLMFALASTDASANWCGGVFSKLGRDNALRVSRQVSEYGSKARVHVLGRLRDLAEKQNKDPKHLYASRPYGDIEPIPLDIRPKDPQIAAMAERANTLLQSEKDILEFVEMMSKQAAETQARRLGESFNPNRMLAPTHFRSPMIEQMAEKQGWGKIIDVEEILEHEAFRVEVLGTGQLHFDFETDGGRHAISAHALQWLMLTPKLEAEFGQGAAKRLLEYLGTPEGYKVWMTTFDRGPAYFRDLRGPYTFVLTGMTGDRSFLGVK